MKYKVSKRYYRALSLFVSLAVLTASFVFSIPARAAQEDDVICYDMPFQPEEFVYSDISMSRYFTLENDKLWVFDAESGVHNTFYDFKSTSIDPSTYKACDTFAVSDSFCFLYQSAGESFVYIINFTKLSIMKNRFKFECDKVMMTKSGYVLVYTPENNGLVYFVKPDGSYGHSNVSVPVEEFYGEDSQGNIYYAGTNGVTFATFDGNSFVPTNRKLTDIDADLTKHCNPVEIFDKSYIADYTGKLFTLNNGDTELVYSFARPLYSATGYQGFGSEIVFLSGTDYVVGMGYNNELIVVNIKTGEQVSSVTTAHNVYALVTFGSRILCFEKDSGGDYCEILSLLDFGAIETRVFYLNEQSVYAGRTKEDIAVRYNQAIGNADLSAPILSDPGSDKAPYAASVVSGDAQQTLLGFSNYQRWLAGLSAYTTGNSEALDAAAKGAILLAASPVKGHYPPKPVDMDQSFYETAYKGTGGNLSYGHPSTISGGIESIRSLTNDVYNLSNHESVSADGTYYQGYNTPGHRIAFLQRGGNHLSYGAADGILVQYYEFAQDDPNHSGNFTETDNNQNAYAWPSPGAFPADEIDRKAVWTVHLNTDVINTSKHHLKISITDLESGETFIRNTVMHDTDGQREGYSLCNYWGKCISFTPPEADSYDGKSYRVTINDLLDARGMPASVTYTINFFDYGSATYIIDGEEYRISDDGKLVLLNPPTEPTTAESTNEPVTTVEPTTVQVTTAEPTTEPASTNADPSTEPTQNPKISFLCGDVNNDGKVNGADAGILSRYSSGTKEMEQRIKNRDAADLNRDGKINGADAGILSRYSSGWTRYAQYIIIIEL